VSQRLYTRRQDNLCIFSWMKPAIRLASLVALLVSLVPPSQGQQVSTSERLPRPSNWVQTDAPYSMVTSDAICESESGIYVRTVKENQFLAQAPFRFLQAIAGGDCPARMLAPASSNVTSDVILVAPMKTPLQWPRACDAANINMPASANLLP